MMRAACNCGAVVFEVSGAIGPIYMCHCSICRRYTGVNGIAVIVVANDAFRWVAGEELIGTWDKPQADWQSHFCTRCGSALPGSNDPERMFVPAGLIPDAQAARLDVAHHIWTHSKAGWDVIGDDGKQHPEAFEG